MRGTGQEGTALQPLDKGLGALPQQLKMSGDFGHLVSIPMSSPNFPWLHSISSCPVYEHVLPQQLQHISPQLERDNALSPEVPLPGAVPGVSLTARVPLAGNSPQTSSGVCLLNTSQLLFSWIIPSRNPAPSFYTLLMGSICCVIIIVITKILF